MTGKAVYGGSNIFDEIIDPEVRVNRLTRDNREVTRTGWVLGTDLDTLIAQCYPPAPYTPGNHPSIPYLFVSDVETTGVPTTNSSGPTTTFDAAGIAVFERWKVRITYAPLPYENDGPTSTPSAGSYNLIQRRWSITADFMTLPSNSVRWDDQDVGQHVQEEEISAAKVIPMVEFSQTRHRSAAPPIATILELVGKVNKDTWEGAAAETALYIGAQIDWDFSADGTQTYRHEHRWQIRPVKVGVHTYGWNHFYRPKDKKWLRLLDDDDNRIYPSATNSEFYSLLLT